MAFSQPQIAQQNADLQSIIKSFQETMSQVTKTQDNSKKSSKKRAEDTVINCFLSDLLRKNPVKHPADKYDHNSIEVISDSLAGLILNSVIKTAVRCAVKKSLDHKCSICRRFEHNFQNCLQKKKKRSKKSKKGKVNLATVDSDSDSSTSSDTSSGDSSDSDTSSEDSSNSGAPLIQEKIESQCNTSPITEVVSLDPDEKEDLDSLMKIDFIKKKEPKTSVATVKCKIKCLKISAMTVDSGTKPPIITENIVICVGAKIDKSETHDLSGIATVPVESVGVVHKLPITLASGCTIHEDFIVVKYQKPMLIIFNQLLKKYNCALD
ncbi:20711_t:CDS:2 [Cetraspora pellucida]|uniref:20711_t:CDS:1 n=1 Tax=Cetraspora pellucida TaxID=1433469 RepID=A0A9N9G7S3_9GLOM|nr:20711_t:CDS:2 [Cetraspora pellucida]